MAVGYCKCRISSPDHICFQVVKPAAAVNLSLMVRHITPHAIDSLVWWLVYQSFAFLQGTSHHCQRASARPGEGRCYWTGESGRCLTAFETKPFASVVEETYDMYIVYSKIYDIFAVVLDVYSILHVFCLKGVPSNLKTKGMKL